jgi:hypothetical protein
LNTEEEENLIDYKGWLCLEALKIEARIGNLRTIKMIMKSIESTYINSNEYLILKAEISVRTREWREPVMAINGTGKNTEVMKEDWVNRIVAVKEKINENDELGKKNTLMSYSNELSKNLFEEDEDINNATKLMWNRDYENATDAACKIWTKIMTNSKPEMIYPKVKVLQIMIESTLSIVMSDLHYAEEWLKTLKKLDYNGIMTRILEIKMMMRQDAEENEIAMKYCETMKGIELVEDALQRKDWYEQMEDLKRFYSEISGRTITIEIPEIETPNPKNIRQTLFSHEYKPENVIVIREEQDASKLRQEIKERKEPTHKEENKSERREEQRNRTLKTTEGSKKEKVYKKKAKKEIKRIETSSDEYKKLSDTEEEKESAEPPYNLEGESMEVLRANWKNEMETYEEKTIPRIMARHFKKIRNGLNLVMIRAAAIFRMINDTNEEDEFKQEHIHTHRSYYPNIYKIR